MKFQLVVVNLDPTTGAEINKTRPCLVISPDEMNAALKTIIVAPLTSTVRAYLPTRIKIAATQQSGLKNESYAALDQIKTIDKSRVVGAIGTISEAEKKAITEALIELFSF